MIEVHGDDGLDLSQFEGHTPGPWTARLREELAAALDAEGRMIVDDEGGTP